jgi:ferredoxin
VKTCERKHKKQSKYESGKTLEAINRTLAGVGVGSTCGGAIEEVLSADGQRVYGERCNRCGHCATRCQVCGRTFENIDRHLVGSKGKPRECYAGNTEYRRAKKTADKLAAMGAVR